MAKKNRNKAPKQNNLRAQLHRDKAYNALVCPCCRQPKALRETPLLDVFFHLKLPHEERHAVVAYTEELKMNAAKHFLDWAARVHTSGAVNERNHTHRWACNACIKAGKAIESKSWANQVAGYYGSYSIAYEALQLTCKRCESPFVFSPKEQLFWYETLGFTQESIPIECPTCRALTRQVKQAQKQLMAMVPNQENWTIEDLKTAIECYEIIGAREKAQLTRNRLHNVLERQKRKETLHNS